MRSIARGSMAACRDHGEVRLEGKEYVVQDGDIINFRSRHLTWDAARRPHPMSDPHGARLRGAGAVRGRRRRDSRARASSAELRARGYDAELVAIPFKWYPKEEILAHAAAWRLLDLSESNGRPIDCVIATKFPTYFARHPHKVTWLIHQYRAAYELCGTPYSDFDHIEGDVALRRTPDRPRHAHAGRVRRRLRERPEHGRARCERTTASRPSRCIIRRIWPAPARRARTATTCWRWAGWRRSSASQLAIEAMAHGRSPVCRWCSSATARSARTLEACASSARPARSRALPGRVDDDSCIELYAGALAVVYAPFDEDFGYVTLEAFLARKPVITARDSGGPLEFVDGRRERRDRRARSRRRWPRRSNEYAADPAPAASAR